MMQLVQISNAFAKCRYVENVGRVESPYQREVLTNTAEHWKVQMHRPYQFTSYKNLVFNEASEWVGNRWPLRAQLAQEQLLNSNLEDDFGRGTTSTSTTTSVKHLYHTPCPQQSHSFWKLNTNLFFKRRDICHTMGSFVDRKIQKIIFFKWKFLIMDVT